MRRTTITAVFLLLTTAPACQDIAEAIASSAASAAEASMPDSAQLAGKLSLYAECTNASRSTVFHAMESLTNHLDNDGSPKGDSASVSEIGDFPLDKCKAAAKDGPGKSPSLPDLEAAQTEYTDSLVALADHVNALHKYFEQQDYKDDKWAQTKTRMPEVVKLFERWRAANDKLDTLLDAKEDESNAQMLSYLESTVGKNAQYHTLAVLAKAKGFLRCLEAEGCDAAFKELEAVHGQFDEYTTGNKAAVDQITLFSWFDSAEEDYFVEAKKFMRGLRDGTLEDNAVNEVIEKYNALIDGSNRVHFPAS
jgi:hypothetical protein